MTHKEKVKLAKRLSGRQKNYFDSPEWQSRKSRIEEMVKKKEEQKKASKKNSRKEVK